MKYIEFVCTRNEWRSPVAELIATWHLQKIWMDEKYSAISSGSHRLMPDKWEIQSTWDADLPIKKLIQLIEIWVEREIFHQEIFDIQKAIEDWDVDKLKQYYLIANKIFKDKERYFRSDAVYNLEAIYWVKWYLKWYSEQTVIRSDVEAIFAMSWNNTDKVREVYEWSKHSPLIETLSVYATWDKDACLPNAFAKWWVVYHDVISSLRTQIPIVIDKFLK